MLRIEPKYPGVRQRAGAVALANGQRRAGIARIRQRDPSIAAREVVECAALSLKALHGFHTGAPAM